MSSPQDRQELFKNAVAFLQDPKTQSSPLTKRIEFLESKGLTTAEIEDAIRQASAGTNTQVQSTISPVQSSQQYAPSYAPSTYSVVAPPPTVSQLDWRDYFIMAVVSGGIMFGVVSLARKYLMPHLKPPSSTAYETDRDALNAQFDAAEALLKEIQEETKALCAAAEEQKATVEKTTSDVQDAVKEMREREARTRDEMREIRQEIDSIHEMLPKMLERNKDSQSQSLAELQQELKSLKTLLLNRGASNPGSSPMPPTLLGRPSIPAWQLENSESSTSSSAIKPPEIASEVSGPTQEA